MRKCFYCLVLLGTLFFSSMAQPSHLQEPRSLPTFREGRRFLTLQEVIDFAHRGQMPVGLSLAGLNIGHVFSMAWQSIESALNRTLTDVLDQAYQNLDNINGVIGIEECYRRLRAKDRQPHSRLSQLARIENNIARAIGFITTTLDSRVRNSFFRLGSSNDRENRQQAFNNIFDINSRFGSLSPALLPVAGSYFHVVITGLISTPPDTFGRNPLLILPFEEDFAFRDFSTITDPICLSAARSLRDKLRIKYHRDYTLQERSFLSNCRDGDQRNKASAAMVEFSRGIEWLHAAMAIPVQRQYLEAKNNATFYKLLADSNLLTPSEIRTLGRSTDLASRVLDSVRTFTSVLVEGIPTDTATKPNLELAIEYSQALASVIKSDSFPQRTKVNALRSLAIDIDAGALSRIANGDRKILRKLDAIRLSWVQQVLNLDGQPELYPQAYTILAAVRDRKLVRSGAVPLVLAALIVKREVLPDGCGSFDDATVTAAELYKEYESTRKDKKEPVEKRRRKPPTPTKDACPYKTAAALHGLAEAIESRLAALMTEDDLSDSGSESDDDDEVVSSAHVDLSASAASAAAAAAPSHYAAGDRSVVEARRLKRQRPAPLPLDTEEEDVVTAAAAAAPSSFSSPESARSRAGKGVGSHHVAPLDAKRKQVIIELYDQFKRTNPTNYVIALIEYINAEGNIQRHDLPHRSEPITKYQIYHLMHPKSQQHSE